MSVGGLVSVIIFLGFSLVEMPVFGSGSGVPNQMLRVFVLFQLSNTWLNSTVKGSAPRLLTSSNRKEILGMSVSTAVVAMTFSNTMNLVQ